MSKKFQTWLYATDFHVPFHNQVLTDKLIKLIKHINPDGLIITEMLDMFSISRYAENSLYALEGLTLGREYKQGEEVLDKFDAAMKPGSKKVYIWGNHEFRWHKFIEKSDNAKLRGALKNPTEGLRLHERGYEVIEDWPDGYYLVGDHLQAMHGIYCNKYFASKHLNELQASMIMGHTHRFQEHSNERYGAFGVGWMGNRDSEGFKYMNRAARANWLNGFAIIYIDDNGYFYVQSVKCFKNHFIIDGKYY